MLERYLRPVYQALFVNPIAKLLIRFQSLSPSYITLMACAFGIISAACIALNFKWIAVFFLLLSGFCDTLDGTCARLAKKCSDVGTTLDIVCDRVVEGALIVGLFLVDPTERALVSLMMLFSILICISSFLVVGLFSENQTEKSFYYSPGIIERAEAFVFFGMMMVLPQFFSLFAWSFTILVFLTAATRLFQFSIKQLR